MNPTGAALRLTVIVGENDQAHHRPLYAEIVHRAHAAGLAGASVFRGCEGYGGSSPIHVSRLLHLSDNLPVVIMIVDTAEKVRAFLPQVQELVTGGLVILDEVEVAGYAGDAPDDYLDAPPERRGRWMFHRDREAR